MSELRAEADERRKRIGDNKTRANFYIQKDLLEKLKKEAEASSLCASDIVRQAIENELLRRTENRERLSVLRE